MQSLPSPSLVSFPVNDLFPAGFLAVYIEQKHKEIVLVSEPSKATQKETKSRCPEAI